LPSDLGEFKKKNIRALAGSRQQWSTPARLSRPFTEPANYHQFLVGVLKLSNQFRR
jgi:hypothetical protein